VCEWERDKERERLRERERERERGVCVCVCVSVYVCVWEREWRYLFKDVKINFWPWNVHDAAFLTWSEVIYVQHFFAEKSDETHEKIEYQFWHSLNLTLFMVIRI